MSTTSTKSKPIRVHRKRGVKLPHGAKSVGRESRWGNPFRVGDRSPHNYNIVIDREHAVMLYRQYLEDRPEFCALIRQELRGHDLACWCELDGQPCHADVLLEIANKDSH